LKSETQCRNVDAKSTEKCLSNNKQTESEYYNSLSKSDLIKQRNQVKKNTLKIINDMNNGFN